jgi:hypothetical protein
VRAYFSAAEYLFAQSQVCSSGLNGTGQRVYLATRLPEQNRRERFKVYADGQTYVHPENPEVEPVKIDCPITVRVNSNGLLICEYHVVMIDGEANEYLSVDSEDDAPRSQRASKTLELRCKAPTAEYLLDHKDLLRKKYAMFSSHCFHLQAKLEEISAHVSNVPTDLQPPVKLQILDFSYEINSHLFDAWRRHHNTSRRPLERGDDREAQAVWHRWVTHLHAVFRRNGDLYNALCK